MSALFFCCSSISPYRPRQLDHEAKFTTFMRWAGLQTTSPVPVDGLLISSAPYAIQLVRQINYGPLESIRYFVPASNGSDFAEATEGDLLESNFEKLNSYLIMNSPTSYRSRTNPSTLQVQELQVQRAQQIFRSQPLSKEPYHAHHWRNNLARPSRDIDLPSQHSEAESSNKAEESALRQDEYDDCDHDFDESESMKDFTACDKECGYCGKCDY